MKKIKKVLSFALVFCVIISMATVFASASSASITAGNTQTMGQNFQVAFNFIGTPDLGSIDATIKYDTALFECVTMASGNGLTVNKVGSEILLSFIQTSDSTGQISFNFTFKALKSGTGTISASAEIGPIGDGPTSNHNASKEITVEDRSALSDNANLKSFFLSNNIPLTPAFDKNVTTYNITVDNSVEKVLVNVAAEDADARVVVQGASTMKIGANTRKIIVTAPNGTQKTYTLNVTRLAPGVPDNGVNPYEIEFEGEKWTLLSVYPAELVLPSFTVSTANINDVDIPALKHDLSGVILVMGSNSAGDRTEYFQYDPINAKITLYRIYKSSAQSLVLLDIPSDASIPAGFHIENIKIGEYSVNVLKYQDSAYSDFAIIYADNGQNQKGYYRYDSSLNTIQRYPEFEQRMDNVIINSNTGLTSRFAALTMSDKLLIGAVLLAVVLLLVFIIISVVRMLRFSRASMDYEIDEFDDLDEFEELEEEKDLSGGDKSKDSEF